MCSTHIKSGLTGRPQVQDQKTHISGEKGVHYLPAHFPTLLPMNTLNEWEIKAKDLFTFKVKVKL